VSGWLHARFALQYDVVVNLRDTSMQQSRRIRLAMAITGAIGAGFLLPVATDVTKGTIGRQMDSIRVPPVIELSEEEATKRLMEAGFPKVSTKVQKRFPADGKVFQQAPGAGHSARRDAEVTLFVREVAGSTPAEPVRRKNSPYVRLEGARHLLESGTRSNLGLLTANSGAHAESVLLISHNWQWAGAEWSVDNVPVPRAAGSSSNFTRLITARDSRAVTARLPGKEPCSMRIDRAAIRSGAREVELLCR
jgi:hypothetical protein